MDQTQLQQKIAEYYQKLPEETKVLFASMSWMEALKEIDTKYGLNDEQVKTLGTETTLLLLGIINLEDYEKTLRNEIKLENNKIEDVIREINEKILKDIVPQLYETFNKNTSELIKEKYGENFDERLSNLPENIKKAINDSNYQSFIYEIGNKYSLNIDQLGILEDITIKVMVGTIKGDQYENEIKSKINIPENSIKEMIVELNENIFKNIKEILKNNWSKKEEVPLPPYTKKVEENKVFSSPSVRETPEEQKGSDIIEKPIEQKRSEIDPYREHGIEILSDENITNSEVVPELKQEENKISSSLPMIETQREQKVPVVEEVIKTEEKKENTINDINTAQELVNPKIGSFDKSNIITDKLFGNTSSKNIVSDYSLPKISSSTQPSLKIESEIPENSHDPYHEVI